MKHERGIKQTLRNVLVQQTDGEVLTKFSVSSLKPETLGWSALLLLTLNFLSYCVNTNKNMQRKTRE